jgi:hypothetical protein
LRRLSIRRGNLADAGTSGSRSRPRIITGSASVDPVQMRAQLRLATRRTSPTRTTKAVKAAELKALMLDSYCHFDTHET